MYNHFIHQTSITSSISAGCDTFLLLFLVKYAVTFSSSRSRRGILWSFPVRLSRETQHPLESTWNARGWFLMKYCSCTPGKTSEWRMIMTKAAPVWAETQETTRWMWPSLSWQQKTQTATTVSLLWKTFLRWMNTYLERLNSSSSLLLVRVFVYLLSPHFSLVFQLCVVDILSVWCFCFLSTSALAALSTTVLVRHMLWYYLYAVLNVVNKLLLAIGESNWTKREKKKVYHAGEGFS